MKRIALFLCLLTLLWGCTKDPQSSNTYYYVGSYDGYIYYQGGGQMRITMSLSQASYIMTFYNSLTGYEEFSLFGSMSFESPNRIILSSKSDFVLGPFMEGSVQHNINPVTLNIPRKYVCDGNEISDLKPQETTSWVNAVNAFPQ